MKLKLKLKLYSKCLILILTLLYGQISMASYTSCVKDGDDHNCKITVEGISQKDFFDSNFEYVITGKATEPEFFSNINMYVNLADSVQNGDGEWSVKVQDLAFKLLLPVNIKKLNDISDDDRRYLKGNSFIQIDKAQKLTSNVVLGKQSYDRLSASYEILRTLNKLVKYDYLISDSGRDDSGTLPTTENILKAGRGICYQFSIVFVAAARSIGIPSRIVTGVKILPNRVGPHAWVEVKLNDDTWWPIEPQNENASLLGVGYLPFSEYNVFEANDINEVKDNYLRQRVIDMQWYDGGITIKKFEM